MAVEQDILVSKKKGVATLTLNRPEKFNAVTQPMMIKLVKEMEKIANDDSMKVMILTGAGDAFCSGTDVSILAKTVGGKERIKQSRHELIEPMGAMILAIANLDKPLIAAVNGVAAGAGLSISLLCDIRIASEQARFGAVWVRRALVPDVGCTYLLPRLIGPDKAFEFMMTGDVINAQEAERIGLVTRVVAHDRLMAATNELASRIAEGPSVAVELTKRGIYRGLSNDLKTQLDYETYAQNVCRQTEDFKEGVTSFLERRKSKFKGS